MADPLVPTSNSAVQIQFENRAESVAAQAEEDDDDDGIFSWFSQLQLDNIQFDEDGPETNPLFMDEQDFKDPKNAATVEWLASLQYDGKDTREIAVELKEKGNKALKGEALQAGAASTKPNPKLAIEIYDDALCNARECGDKKIESTIWSNRAMAQMKLRNWRHVMHDCVKAIRLDKGSIKPYWRGAQAALKIQRFDEAVEFCMEGLKVDEDNTELKQLLSKGEQGATKAKREKEQKDAAIQRAAAHEKLRLDAVRARGIRITARPEWLDSTYHLDLRGSEAFYIDEDLCLHWAVGFLYPEHAQSDLVQDFHEECALIEQLEMMFPPAVPPVSWDVDRKYVLPRLILCYERSATTDGKQPKSKYGIIPPETTLKELLSLPDMVVPGYPIFHVVIKDSPFAQQYLDDSYIY